MSRSQPGQHFLLSKQARTLSLARVMRMSDDEAFEAFKAIRWATTNGEPVCPRCGCVEAYAFATSRRFKCKACSHKFSVTVSNGAQFLRATGAALAHPVSRQFKGYWQRAAA